MTVGEFATTSLGGLLSTPVPSKIFNYRPHKAHLARGGGLSGEVSDLRRDVDAAFQILEESVDLHTEPLKIKAWDGSQRLCTLLEEGHVPNMYEVRVIGSILSNDGNGIFVVTSRWHDPDLGHQSIDSDNILISGEPGLVTPYSRPFFSDGEEAITVQLESFGTHPSQGITLYLQVARIG